METLQVGRILSRALYILILIKNSYIFEISKFQKVTSFRLFSPILREVTLTSFDYQQFCQNIDRSFEPIILEVAIQAALQTLTLSV